MLSRGCVDRALLPRFFVCRMRWSRMRFGIFRWEWLALYALLPVGVALLLDQARSADTNDIGNWRDFVILAALGLAVDLRWLEPAWPRGIRAFGKMLLLDAGIYGFLACGNWMGRLRSAAEDCTTSASDFASLCSTLSLRSRWGLASASCIFTRNGPSRCALVGAFVFTFLFIAIPEELFFRGWLQNLLERRMGRTAALVLTAILFGLSHWNKRTTNFNWRYVLHGGVGGNLLWAGRGALSAASAHPLSPMRRSILCGPCGSDEDGAARDSEIAHPTRMLCMTGRGNRDRHADAEDRVRHGQRPDVARSSRNTGTPPVPTPA